MRLGATQPSITALVEGEWHLKNELSAGRHLASQSNCSLVSRGEKKEREHCCWSLSRFASVRSKPTGTSKSIVSTEDGLSILPASSRQDYCGSEMPTLRTPAQGAQIAEWADPGSWVLQSPHEPGGLGKGHAAVGSPPNPLTHACT